MMHEGADQIGLEETLIDRVGIIKVLYFLYIHNFTVAATEGNPLRRKKFLNAMILRR